jgi:hypothetical protein
MIRRTRWPAAAVLALVSVFPLALAAPEEAWPPAIEDNSFLVEEAYNQEAGVVQWIFTFQQFRPSGAWYDAFTTEWPVPDQTNQLSLTIPYIAETERLPSGWGDVSLNYRYQALAGGERGWWFAPRLSAILPTGNWRQDLGNGAPGVQIGFPFSRRFTRGFAMTLNAAGQYVPLARGEAADGRSFKADAWGVSEGVSLVWLVSPRFNLMLEAVATQDRVAVDDGRTENVSVALASPSFRWAINFRSGQLVLGAAVPIGLTEASPDWSMLFYVSWESALWTPRSSTTE